MTETDVSPHRPTLNIPGTPREITRRASSRAWAEMGVQLWWKSATAVLLVAAYVAYMQVSVALRQRELMEKGVPVVATIVEVKQTSRPNFAEARDDVVPVKLRFRRPGEEQDTVMDVRLRPMPVGFAKVGEELKLRIDPKDPSNWDEEFKVQSWSQVLALPVFLLLPVVVLLSAMAWWQRRKVLEVWRDGRRMEGVVVEARHASWAPRSRVLRYRLAESAGGREKRVFRMLYPAQHGVPGAGEPIDLIAPHDQPQRAIAAALYLPRYEPQHAPTAAAAPQAPSS